MKGACATAKQTLTPHTSLGVTGYIGGDVFVTINLHHPEYEWTFLVRDAERVVDIQKQYPNTRVVQGSLDSYELIVDEVARADIVLSELHPDFWTALAAPSINWLTARYADWADADHKNAAEAIKTGMKKRTAPGFLIHTSGAGILTVSDIHNGAFGTESPKLYNDWDGVSEVTSLPDDAAHRDVDKIVIASNAESSLIHTAIVCPPCIYGEGRGPGKRRSIQVPEMIRCTLERGKGFQVGQGRNKWRNVHIQDLSVVYLRLVEEATKPDGGGATWGSEGYYFAESGEHYWGDVAQAVANEACKLGIIKSSEIDSLDIENTEAIQPFGRYLWGTNSRHRAVRAKKVLGWELAGFPTLADEISHAVEAEAKRLRLVEPMRFQLQTWPLL